MTASSPMPPPPPPARSVSAAEGALAALGLVALGSVVSGVPYLLDTSSRSWSMLLHVGQSSVITVAGVLALLSLIANGSTRVASAALAVGGGALGVVSVVVALAQWFDQLDSSMPDTFVVGNLLSIGANAGHALMVMALGGLLLVRRA